MADLSRREILAGLGIGVAAAVAGVGFGSEVSHLDPWLEPHTVKPRCGYPSHEHLKDATLRCFHQDPLGGIHYVFLHAGEEDEIFLETVPHEADAYAQPLPRFEYMWGIDRDSRATWIAESVDRLMFRLDEAVCVYSGQPFYLAELDNDGEAFHMMGEPEALDA